ncbi:gliding motility-associated C-terminal domain-containing protein, partial [Lutibacter sp. TH_r2]|uniref:Ig-like domain-containing protein n=1 Tax=Lutibacter sp. TH_r2 TaxID=3082083 RepID=UPI0029548CFF
GGEPSYSVIKVSDVLVVSYEGDVITYTITVENTSTYGINNLQVVDELVDLVLTDGDDNSNNILDVNEIWTYVGSYEVTAETLSGYGVNELGEVDNDGDVDNIVTVTGNNPADTLLDSVNDSATVLVYLPPVAVDDMAETDANIPVDISILENDYDLDGTLVISSVEITLEPENGTVVINSDGTVTYTPDFDFIGEDSFEYQVCDNDGLCDTAMVYLTVIGVLAEELVIPEGFSPNGDGVHDEFVIQGLSNLYPDFQLVIYNRWGNIVSDYKHNGDPLAEPKWWDGFSDGRMTISSHKELPVGTYFYTIYFNKEGHKPRAGYVYLNR